MSFEYAGIHLLDNPFFLDNTYDYYIPLDLRSDICVGRFVIVPFGQANRRRIGLITALREKPIFDEDTCKPIFSLCSEGITLSEEMLGLAHFMREHTLCTIGEAVKAMIPASVISGLREVWRPLPCSDENITGLDETALLVYEYILEKGSVRFDLLKNRFGSSISESLAALRRAGIAVRDYELFEKVGKSENCYILKVSDEEADRLCAPPLAISKRKPEGALRSEAQIKIIEVLREQRSLMSESELALLAGAKPAQLRALCDKGIIEKVLRPLDRSSLEQYIGEAKRIELNGEQTEALNTLSYLYGKHEPKAALLHGVTGSGKTCVMMKLIDRVLEDGRGVILLLPEIALTPQTLGLFCSRYGERVALIHSALSAGERFDTYNKIKSGACDVVIGTRSAVFAPLKDLGLIIIDEEQEHTYKSDTDPKYHARDIARYRCTYNSALMLLASATPSLESYRKAEEGKYTLIKLKERYGGAKLPKVTIADMRGEAQGGNLSPLGTLLSQKLVQNHAAGGQSVLFLNRRGYNNFISCRSCGEAIKCQRCSVSMTYHTTGRGFENGELRCHWCGRTMPLPAECPECHSPHLVRMGYGTQRIEQELSELLPDARILRMDADSASSKFAYEDMLGKVRKHEADLLLGTQMVTKGHDFPDVTLVGVLLADSSLYLDDYRAAERTFAMITQVVGRAGRGEKEGEAVIQTNNPDHECIKLACAQDYESFYASEIRLRRLLTFPPICDLALLTITSADEHELVLASKRVSEKISELFRGEYEDITLVVYGPFEAPVYKVENKYRMRFVTKCRLNKRTRAFYAELLSHFSRHAGKRITLSIDFNPSNL